MSSSKARFFNPAVIGLIMLSFFLGTSEYTVIGILPEIADGFGISLTQAGSIVSLFAFAYGLGTPFLAAYVGKYNRFRITMLGISLFALCNLICAIAVNYTVFLVFRILTAVVSGTVVSISMTYAEDVASIPEAYPGCDRRCLFRLQHCFCCGCAYRFHYHANFWLACGFYHDLRGNPGSAGASVCETAAAEPAEGRKYPGTV